MNEQFETELAAAFGRHLSRIPGEAVERLRRIDYHPRTHRLSPRVTIGALTGAATTATVVSVVLLTGTTPAFAGWTTRPTKPSKAQTAAASSSCETQLASMNPSSTDWNPVVTDVRGPYSLVVYEDAGGAYATCLTGPSITAVSQNTAGGGSGSVLSSSGSSGAGQGSSSSLVFGGSADIEQMSAAHMNSSSGPYSVAEGQVASDVSAVTLVLSDGSDVQTTTGGGWFVAWWPASEDAASAEITTPSGVTSQSLTAPSAGERHSL